METSPRVGYARQRLPRRIAVLLLALVIPACAGPPVVPGTIVIGTWTPSAPPTGTLAPTTPAVATGIPSSSVTPTTEPSVTPNGMGALPVVPGPTIESDNLLRVVSLADVRLEGGKVAWSPDGLSLAVGTRTTVVVLAPLSGTQVRTFVAPEGWDNPSPAFGAVAFSADGTQVAGGFTVIVAVWDLATGDLVNEHHNVSGEVTSVAYSPNGLWIAASGMRGGFISPSTSTDPSFWIDSAPDIEWSVSFSPDSRILASTGPVSIRIWDPPSGALVRRLQGGGFQLAFSPDGSVLADGMRLWNPSSGELVRTLTFRPAIHQVSLAFGPSGDFLALGFDDGSIEFFDAATGGSLHTLAAHAGRVRGLAFSPDGRLLASMGSDDVLRIWGVGEER
jgi:WD40 repeat protein